MSIEAIEDPVVRALAEHVQKYRELPKQNKNKQERDEELNTLARKLEIYQKKRNPDCFSEVPKELLPHLWLNKVKWRTCDCLHIPSSHHEQFFKDDEAIPPRAVVADETSEYYANLIVDAARQIEEGQLLSGPLSRLKLS